MSGAFAPYAGLLPADTWLSGVPSMGESSPPVRNEDGESVFQSLDRWCSSYADAKVTRVQWTTESASRDLMNRDADALRGVTRWKSSG